jgi:hypothetical protein
MTEQPKPESPAPNSIPTKDEVATLPRWAMVAFAARCARRVQPVFTAAWPSVPSQHVEAVATAIASAEATAKHARTSFTADPALAADAADAAARAAARSSDAADAADAAARTAARAARAAANAVDTASYAARAADAAAAFAATNAASPMRSDFNLLVALSKQLAWTDDSPVDVALLGPLWPPEMEPAWAKKKQAAPTEIDFEAMYAKGAEPQRKLVLKFTVPPIPNTAENRAELVAHMKAAILGASALHIAQGGSGLKIDDVKAWAGAAVETPVPSSGNGGGR